MPGEYDSITKIQYNTILPNFNTESRPSEIFIFSPSPAVMPPPVGEVARRVPRKRRDGRGRPPSVPRARRFAPAPHLRRRGDRPPPAVSHRAPVCGAIKGSLPTRRRPSSAVGALHEAPADPHRHPPPQTGTQQKPPRPCLDLCCFISSGDPSNPQFRIPNSEF